MKAPDKICPECQTSNNDDAKFCSHCGFKFSELKDGNICDHCGTANKIDARFCANCGNNLEKKIKTNQTFKKSKKKQRSRQRKTPVRKKSLGSHTFPIIVIIGGLIWAVLYVFDDQDTNNIKRDQFVSGTGQNLVLDDIVYTVASRFTCSCGSCGEEALETCTCNTAALEREFIKNELQKGKSFNQVIAAVYTRYGHPKPEFKKTILQISEQDDSPKVKSITVPAAPTMPVKTMQPAVFQDRQEIYSHFECPCGQCGIPELTDCNCDHPGGATEVKNFIDEKINEGKFTIAQIVEKVNEHYGHKIR